MNAVQTGFVDTATAASVKATKAIAAADTVERKAVAKADVVLAQDLQSAWGTYAAAERSAVNLNARERATIGADYKKEVAGAKRKGAGREKVPATKSGANAVGSSKGTYLNMLGREVRPARRTPNGIQNPLLRDLDKGMWQQETHFFIEEILRKAR